MKKNVKSDLGEAFGFMVAFFSFSARRSLGVGGSLSSYRATVVDDVKVQRRFSIS
jgi:hypothetical protein